jgi:hypothetical protein
VIVLHIDGAQPLDKVAVAWRRGDAIGYY